MNQALVDLFGRLVKVLNYPPLKLSDASITLSTIFKLALLVGLVLMAERLLRRQLLRRLFHRTRPTPSVQFAITRLTG